MKRGFLLGKFMPPHAGHMALIEAAQNLVDELTVLVCWLPDDPIAGARRVRWMRELFPTASILEIGDDLPQTPEDHADFWAIWAEVVRNVHPEPIDYVFAGEAYGANLAQHVGGLFVPLGARILGADQSGIGGVSASAIRKDIIAGWPWLPALVQRDLGLRVCLHGVESTGKSVLCEKLAQHYGTIWVPEYGRIHCETHGTDLSSEDLLLLGDAQRAMIEAAVPWSCGLMFSDTDHLMTAAWHEMMLGTRLEAFSAPRHAGLYLLLDADVPWVDDGTRIYGDRAVRAKFAQITEDVLVRAGVPLVRLSGSWQTREDQALAAIEAMPRSLDGP